MLPQEGINHARFELFITKGQWDDDALQIVYALESLAVSEKQKKTNFHSVLPANTKGTLSCHKIDSAKRFNGGSKASMDREITTFLDSLSTRSDLRREDCRASC